MRRPPRRVALLALLATSLVAQAPTAAGPERWTSPDGSRFVLLVDREQPQVIWVVATLVDPAYDPPGLPGLAAVAHAASLGGTWRYGSTDVARERDALQQLDAAVSDLVGAPSPEGVAKVKALEQTASALGDPRAFLRVFATAPADEIRLQRRDNIAWLQLTTVAAAIPQIADLLVDRRENQVLRELPKYWIAEVTARQRAFDGDRVQAVYAELLALAMPDHPGAGAAERPRTPMVRRSLALANWAGSQYPTRTVYVLFGNFDAAVAKAELARAFAKTTLPEPKAVAIAQPRPLTNMRRSTVPGVGKPIALLAWVLPPVNDPFLLQLAARWFGDGADSWIGKQLVRSGHEHATVRCLAPWPPTQDGKGLFVVEVRAPRDNNGIADLVQAAAASAPTAKLGPGAMNPVLTAMQRSWSLLSIDPSWVAGELAGQALLWPQSPVRTAPDASVPPEKVQALLARIFASKPAIVEGTP
ncbi:MAG: hypothetical protein U1E73_05005 [Planctomycetota bacterium]